MPGVPAAIFGVLRMVSRIDSDPRAPASQPSVSPPDAAAPAARPVPVPRRVGGETSTGSPGPNSPTGPSPSAALSRPAGGLGQTLHTAVPAWAVSLLVHLIAFIALALVVTGPTNILPPTPITSSISERVEEFTEFEVQEMSTDDLITDAEDPAADLLVTTDVAVEPVEVASLANDLDAAPLSVELADFGADSAAPSDMLASVGAIGGEAGGLGGRGKAGALARSSGGGADTEAAVERSLRWFLRHQLPDGSWSCNFAECPSCMGKCSHGSESSRAERAAATAMALLPYLGRGETHLKGPYRQQIQGGIRFLVSLAAANNGRVYDPERGTLYTQGLVGIALSECYAMSRDANLRLPTQAVLNYIMEAQDSAGGGWRYHPGQAGDTSAVGWQIMALKSGFMSGIRINPLTVTKAGDFLDFVQSDDGARYGYLDKSSPSDARSAVGLLCRMYMGWKKDHPAMEEGVKRLAKRGPTDDLYYDYYATQIMHHMGGDLWKAWNDRMKPVLLKSQATEGDEAGSWHDGFGTGHAAEVGGRLYCTSMATMILEVYYRHLPMYQTETLEQEFRE